MTMTTTTSSPRSPGTTGAADRFEVLDFFSPFKGLHPTSATLRDKETGLIYEWNSRAHRRLRQVALQGDTSEANSSSTCPRFRLFCWEPHIVSWWVIVTNMIANIFWTISGVFATWPSTENAARIVYATGILAGVFMILSCYFTYVEAINHSHGDIILPKSSHDERRKTTKKRRSFVRPFRVYGKNRSPIGHANHGIDSARVRRRLREMGYPYVESYDTHAMIKIDDYRQHIPTTDKVDEDDEAAAGGRNRPFDCYYESLIGKKVNISDGRLVFTTAILEINRDAGAIDKQRSYQWWTWYPALDHLGVLTSLIGFFSSIVYLVPMCVGYPLSKNETASMGVLVFFGDVLQAIPYICFTAICYLLMVEAGGSWCKPKLDSIGWWVSVFNYVGAWGFLFCGALAIPVTLGSTCCSNMAKWGSAFACFWGSAAYLVGGILMCIEFANPEPISCFCCCKGKIEKHRRQAN